MLNPHLQTPSFIDTETLLSYGGFRVNIKQNWESTKGYSKSIVRKYNDKFIKRIGLNV